MTAEPPQPIDPSFRIELPSFEGPLDLLLHLIQKHELEILDLPIAFVTEKYLAYIGMMKQLNLDVASEYLVMAAELARIKSKMLLPPSDEEDEEEDLEEEIDPRADLIRRLLEYQKYKRAGEELGSRGVAGRDVFVRGAPAPQAEGPAPLAEVSVFRLLDALQKVLDRTKADLAFEVSAERISIQERIQQVTDVLQDKRRCKFEELFEGATTKYDIVVTFLAILEMAKMRMMRIYQPEPLDPIYLEYRLLDADDGEEGEGGAEAGSEPETTSEPEAEPEAEPRARADEALDLPGESVQDPPAAEPGSAAGEQDLERAARGSPAADPREAPERATSTDDPVPTDEQRG